MLDLSQLKFLGEGRNRKVYLLFSGKNVIKIPKNDDGIRDNCIEDFRYRKNRDKWFPLAKCRLVNYSNYHLVMEYVKQAEDPYGLATWVYSVDCGQVGFTNNGKLVAYDYAF